MVYLPKLVGYVVPPAGLEPAHMASEANALIH